jgi:hypothetical protein
MYQLSRVCVGNYGHSDARFKSSLADFRKRDGLTAGSVMLFAPNGNGKTTFLSYMLHLFKPNKRDFVQTKQKPMHRMEAYFKEGQPGFIIMDLTVRDNGLIVSDKPALVIGAITERKGDDIGNERFFMIDPRQGMTFDDIEFIKPILAGDRADVTKEQIESWVSANKGRPGFAFYSGKNEWTKALEAWGFNLKSFDVMVTMAEKEGGIEKFLEENNPDTILERVFQLFTDEDAARVVIDELEGFLEDHAAIPETRRIMETELKLVEMELALHDAELQRVASEKDMIHARREAASAHAVAAGRLSEIQQENQRHQAASKQAAADLVVAERRLREEKIRQEAVRVVARKIELERCRSQQSDLARRRQNLLAEKLLFTCLPSANQIRSLKIARTTHEAEIERLRQNDRDMTVPLSKAGAGLRAAISAQIEQLGRRISERETEYKKQTEIISQSRDKQTEVASAVTLRTHNVDKVLKARGEIQNACATIAQESNTTCANGLEAIAIRDRLRRDRETRTFKIAEMEAATKDARRSADALEKDISRLHGDLEIAQAAATAARIRLAGYEASEARLRSEHFDYLKTGAVFDIADAGIDVELDNDRDVWMQKRAIARGEIELIERQIAVLGSSGMFVDEDVQQALRMCQEAGVSDVSTYVSWISKNAETADEAREFTERNLHFTLGLRVNTVMDLAKIRKVFDRAKWNLGKPVPVTVVRSMEDMERLGHGVEQIILSSATDYAYHEPTRLDQLDRVRDALSKQSEIAEYADSYLARIDSCRRELTNHRQAFHGKTHASLSADLEHAEDRVRVVTAESASRQDDRDHADEEMRRLSADLAAAREEITPFEAIVARIDALVDQITRNDKEANLGLSVASEREEIAALKAEAEAQSKIQWAAKDRSEEIASAVNLAKRDREALAYELGRIEFGKAEAHEGELLPMDVARAEYENQLRMYLEKAGADERIEDLVNSIGKVDWQISEKETQLRRDAGAKKQDPAFLAELESRADLGVHDAEEALATTLRHIEDAENQATILASESGRLEEAAKMRPDLRDLHDAVATVVAELIATDGALTDSSQDPTALARLEAEIESLNSVITSSATSIAATVHVVTELSACVPDLAQAARDAAPLDGEFDGKGLDWTSLSRALSKEAARLDSKHSRDWKTADGHHNAIRNFLGRAENSLSDNSFRDRLQAMDSHIAHARESLKFIDILNRKIEASQASIDRSDKAQADLVKSVKKVLDGAIKKVISAASVKVPDNSGPFSGHPLIKLPSGIDRTALNDVVQDNIASRYVAEQLSMAKRVPLKHSSQMAVGLLKMVARTFDRESFCLRILKPVDQAEEPTWEEIHKLTGSGGQTITAALLLVMVASNMNDEDSNGMPTQSFMILDNPIGKANKTSLVGLQLMMAKHFGIQMIATSGINDQYLSRYEWIVSFNVTTRYGKTKEATLRYDDNLIDGLVHKLKSPVTAKAAA